MNKEVEITCTLDENSNIVWDYPKIMPRILRHFGGKKLLMKLSVLTTKRSDAQNRYLHGVVCVSIMYWHKQNTGEKYTIDEVKAFIYMKILGYNLKCTTMLGQEVFIMEGKHFSQMNTVEFNEAKEKVQDYFAELGCVIPDPNQNNFITDFENE